MQRIVLNSLSSLTLLRQILSHFLDKAAESKKINYSEHFLKVNLKYKSNQYQSPNINIKLKAFLNIGMQPRVVRIENQQPQQSSASQKRRLLAQIQNQKQQILKMDERLNVFEKEYKKMIESNQRNIKRLMRHRTRYQELVNHRNQPEYFLQMCGFMNQYMQEFMIAHDVEIMNFNQQPNTDNMSYEQLLELGESIGKVSKGISKEQFELLPRKKNISSDHNCPICCTEFSAGETAVALRCKHLYHEECICEWLKDQNTCPICKKNVLQK